MPALPPHAQMHSFGGAQQLGGGGVYGQPGMPPYGHQQPQPRLGSCGGQRLQQQGKGQSQPYADYALPAGAYGFGGAPYGGSSGGMSSGLSLPSSLGGMAAGYPAQYADPSGYNAGAGGYGGYDGLGGDFRGPQGLYMGQQPPFPQGHNGN